ncbi:methyl-accepting chemotaxis protein [Gracilibacillus oryzae]|uniref:Methyl-accepting chemotaxis protein n=1 Tax=Gracilibacillus oryzae TaxID=1672701 RepID=A0A7C8GX20_9BACI|nr:methyl-accepting chemotaxis protein [Gracilibacillus oryzae]KAB8139324.1 methyl-accepting chemotaxis protein [Gracilibacillus oryzae]
MKKIKLSSSVTAKLNLLIIGIVLITGIVIGTVSYNVAKNHLLESGQSELRKIADGAFTVLELLNQDVEEGTLTLEQAKDRAREILNGPVNSENEYDYMQTNFVYKNEGYVLAYDQSLVLQLHPSKIGGEPADELNRSNRANLVEAGMETNPEDRFAGYNDEQPDGSYRQKTAYMRYFEPWDWTVGIAVFEDEFYEGLHNLKYVIVAITGAIIVASSIIFYLLIRRKLNLLKNVAEAAATISSGNISQTELPESKDEIGLLAVSFNRMSGELKRLVTSVQQSSEHLLDSATDLSAISEQTSASSQEVGTAMMEISSGAQEQANDLEDVHSRVELLMKTVQQMKEETVRVETVMQQTEQVSNKGMAIVSKLKVSNKQSADASSEISSDMKQLSDKVKRITTVMDTIEHIAEETNLLALNASIEAARAGEHGKGFAVVADEIRKLAEQSKKAAHQVQDVISTVVKETNKTVEAVNANMKSTESLNMDVLETEGKFADLQKAIEKIALATSSLNNNMAQITNQTEMMSESIESVSSVSEETAASVEEISSSIDEQVNAITNVAKAAESLTNLNHELSDLLRKYHVS